MNDEQPTPTIEVIAPTIEEAIEKGLSELNLSHEAVEIEILDKGSRGFLGVGARQVRIRISAKKLSPSIPQPAPIPKELSSMQIHKEDQPTEDTQEDTENIDWDDEFVANEKELLKETTTILETLLKHLKIRAFIKASIKEKASELNHSLSIPFPTKKYIYLNITGKDLSILIGRQAENLQALQLITNLLVNKKLGRAIPLIVDVEGYRERRKNQLLQIAHRMAEQAIRTGRRQVLEPMSSEDRRLIHLELRDHPSVYTESIGEEPRRKVTIVPK